MWPRAAGIGLVAAVILAIPADIINTSIFHRPVPPRSIDYPIWIITSLLIGLVLAIRTDAVVEQRSLPESAKSLEPNNISTLEEKLQTRTLMSGFASFLAIGCPVCNQVVVALVGTSGALAWWSPVQPVIGFGAIAVLLFSLRKRLCTYELDACRLPASKS